MALKRAKLLLAHTWIGIFILSTILFLHYTRIALPFENMITRLIQPVQATVYSEVQDLVNKSEREEELRKNSKEDLIKKHIDLEDQLENLIIENTRLQVVVQDAELLKEQIDFLKEQSYQAISARVVSRSTESLTQTLIINKGAKQGLQPGLPAVINNGLIIGTINDVQDFTAEILLLTSFDSHVSAVIQNEQQSPGIVSGEHNLSLSMNYIPQLDTVLVQDTVVTGGVDENIPEGLLIGQIKDVVSQSGQLFQQANITPFAQVNEITIVSIILP